MSALELYEAGQLSAAIQAAVAEVKSHPTDTRSRYLLAVLLCFDGQLERADQQLKTLSTQRPEAAVGVALLRQLIRAELSRFEFHTAGRLPEFTATPPDWLQQHIKASICIREGQMQEAADLLAAAEEQRPRVAGTLDGREFADLRDLDDLIAPVFEALTSTGKYYWVPMSDVINLELSEPESMADVLWRPVRLTVRDGPPGAVYMPSLYFGSEQAEQENLRLGRATEWIGGEQTPVRGRGLRMFLVGDDARPIIEMKRLEIRSDNRPDESN